MVTATSSVRLYDGLAELAGVSSRAIARKPAFEVEPVAQVRRRVPDRVELSTAACRDGRCDEHERDQDEREIEKLRSQDRQIRTHERAHKATSGMHGGPVSYTYKTGPDGKRYAVAGEVPIDVTPVKGDPEATILKMRKIRSAALAPAEPSAADRRVAAKAQQLEREARAEKRQEPRERLDVYA